MRQGDNRVRNYAQHRGIAIHGTSYNRSWIGDRSNLSADKLAKLRHSASASIDLARITKDKKFKASVASELPKDKTSIDVSDMTRRYVEALAGVHDAVRQAIAGRIGADLDSLRGAIQRYSDINDGDASGLVAAALVTNKTVESTDIFEELLAWYEHLRARNGKLINLRKFYVSNEILDKRRL